MSISLASLVGADGGEIDVNAPAQETTTFTPPVQSDQSALWIRSGTRIYLMITDPHGRKTGVDSKTHKSRQDIPNSECDADFIENPYTQDPYSELNERITLQPAAKGVYLLHITGLQPGPFDVALSAQSRAGSSLPTKDLEGLISEGEEKTFTMTFEPNAHAPLRIVEEAAKQ